MKKPVRSAGASVYRSRQHRGGVYRPFFVGGNPQGNRAGQQECIRGVTVSFRKAFQTQGKPFKH